MFGSTAKSDGAFLFLNSLESHSWTRVSEPIDTSEGWAHYLVYVIYETRDRLQSVRVRNPTLDGKQSRPLSMYTMISSPWRTFDTYGKFHRVQTTSLFNKSCTSCCSILARFSHCSYLIASVFGGCTVARLTQGRRRVHGAQHS